MVSSFTDQAIKSVKRVELSFIHAIVIAFGVDYTILT
jgi:hypothetical protein